MALASPAPSATRTPWRRWPVPANPALVLLLAAYILLALAYNASTPIFEAPDEHTHYAFAAHLAAGGGLPIQPLDRNRRGPWEQEGSQPPLYHALVAFLLRATGTAEALPALWYNDQNTMGQPALLGNENRFIHPPAEEGWPWQGLALAVHLARGFSMLLGLGILLSVWSIAGRVFASPSALPLAAVALAAFNPQFLALSGAITNDILIATLAAVALALLLAILDPPAGRPWSDWKVLGLVAVTAAAPLAKLSGLVLLAFVVATLGGVAWISRGDRERERRVRPLLGLALAVALAAVLVSGWWYLRNVWLYGEPLGTSRMLVTHGRAFRWDRWLAGLPDELTGVWFSSWGLFGWFTVTMPQAVYATISALAFLALAGLLRLGRRWRQPPTWLGAGTLAWLLAWGGLVCAGLLRWLMLAKGGQGRLLAPALATLAVALVAGWRALLPRRVSDRVLATTVTGVMLALAVYALFGVVDPAFAPAPAIAMGAVPASVLPAAPVFDGRLRLVAADLPERVSESQVFPITLYWQATSPITREGYVAVRFDQHVVAESATPASAGSAGAFGDSPAEGKDEPNTMLSPPPGMETRSSQPQLSYLAGGNTPPALLAPGDGVYVDRRTLVAPALASPERQGWRPPVAARLSLHLYDQTRAERWPMTAGAEDADATEWSATVVIAPQHARRSVSGAGWLDLLTTWWQGLRGASGPVPKPLTGYVEAARFAGGLSLWRQAGAGDGAVDEPAGSAAAVRAAGVADPAGSTWTELPVYWELGADLHEDLTEFVHVVDAEGQRVDGFDGPPANLAELPTRLWRRGDRIPALIRWRWPGERVAGEPDRNSRGGPVPYGLQIGLYRAADGVRLPAYHPGGAPWAGDAVRLLAPAGAASSVPQP